MCGWHIYGVRVSNAAPEAKHTDSLGAWEKPFLPLNFLCPYKERDTEREKEGGRIEKEKDGHPKQKERSRKSATRH